jgi:hypothetical protein
VIRSSCGFLLETVEQLACGAVAFEAWFKHEGTRGVGQLRVDEMYVRKRSLRFDLETHPQRAATTAAKARAVRGVYHFDFFKHRTAAMRCQTENSLTTEAKQFARAATAKLKSAASRREVRDFLFTGSTDPVAKEHLFLE